MKINLLNLERELDSTESVEYSGLMQKAIDWYLEPKSIEKWRNGKVYELLGIKKFKKLLTNLAFYKRVVRTHDNLDSLDSLLNFSELVHSPPAVFFWGMTIASSLSNENYAGAFAILGGIGFLTNAYCTMLQRYNRIKTNRIRRRMEERKRTKDYINEDLDYIRKEYH